MDPLRIYDYLALARQRLLDWARPLSTEQLAREFPIGRTTLARTLTHTMISEWYYIERLRRRPVPDFYLCRSHMTWPLGLAVWLPAKWNFPSDFISANPRHLSAPRW